MQQTSARHYGKAILLSFVFLLLALAALSFYNVLLKKAGLTSSRTAQPENVLTNHSAQVWTVGLIPDRDLLARASMDKQCSSGKPRIGNR